MQRGIDRSDAEPGAGGPEALVSSVPFLTWVYSFSFPLTQAAE